MVHFRLFYNGMRSWMFCFVLFSVYLFIEAKQVDSLKFRLNEENIDSVIKKLTLEEKVRLLVGTAKMPPLPPEPAPGAYRRPPFPEGLEFSTFFIKGRVSGAAGDSYSVPRIGIPAITFADGPAGLRIDSIRENCPGHTFYATAFPVALLLASTWDKELVYEVGKSMGEEALQYGVDILLAPGVNIHRNPLTGRNFEYYSEDPIVAGEIAAAMINGVQSNGVGTSIKHFAANNQEKYRNGINVIVSERALREIYLKVFEIAVRKASPWTVMSAYNKINGIYASELKALLTTVLREEWGFEGFVMTDWWGEHDPVAQMKAGNDLLMPGTEEQIQEIIEKVRTGYLSVEVLDRNVRNVLGVLVKTPTFNAYPFTNKPNLKQHAEMVRKAAGDGMVLLKNEQAVLPIIRNNKVALLGNAAYDIIVGGTGSGFVNRAYKISLLEGMLDAQIDCDMTVARKYQQYLAQEKKNYPPGSFWNVPIVAEMPLSDMDIERIIIENDIAVYTVGRSSGEGSDRALSKGDYYLNDTELENLQKLSEALHSRGKKLVVVLNIGGVIDMASWENYSDAILLAWQPGQEAGYSIADILTGKINPSGHLTTTFPLKYEDVASAPNFSQSDGNPAIVKYREGIYVGYRYYSSFNVSTSYEFGYGLSYTQFRYTDFALDRIEPNGDITLSLTVTNIGKYAGKDVVQIYVSAPDGQIEKPVRELKSFYKTKLLQPGEKQCVTFTLGAKDFAVFDAASSAWVVEKGKYQLQAGYSSVDIAATLELVKDNNEIVEKTKPIFSSAILIDELTRK